MAKMDEPGDRTRNTGSGWIAGLGVGFAVVLIVIVIVLLLIVNH